MPWWWRRADRPPNPPRPALPPGAQRTTRNGPATSAGPFVHPVIRTVLPTEAYRLPQEAVEESVLAVHTAGAAARLAGTGLVVGNGRTEPGPATAVGTRDGTVLLLRSGSRDGRGAFGVVGLHVFPPGKRVLRCSLWAPRTPGAAHLHLPSIKTLKRVKRQEEKSGAAFFPFPEWNAAPLSVRKTHPPWLWAEGKNQSIISSPRRLPRTPRV